MTLINRREMGVYSRFNPETWADEFFNEIEQRGEFTEQDLDLLRNSLSHYGEADRGGYKDTELSYDEDKALEELRDKMLPLKLKTTYKDVQCDCCVPLGQPSCEPDLIDSHAANDYLGIWYHQEEKVIHMEIHVEPATGDGDGHRFGHRGWGLRLDPIQADIYWR
jgi:hypothetical protein